jgi:hypothetical protein
VCDTVEIKIQMALRALMFWTHSPLLGSVLRGEAVEILDLATESTRPVKLI